MTEQPSSEAKTSLPTEAMCDQARGFIMGLDLGCRSWGAMSKHLANSGRPTLDYIENQAKDNPKGHITKWDVADCIWQLMARTAPEPTPSFQSRVAPWMQACFGPEISADTTERNHRFLEEAIELVQACGATREECLQLVDYVYGRPVGEPSQEVGGVMVTLAALCLAGGIDMHQAGETELARIWTKVEQIRAKQAGKPKVSPLPGKLSFIRNAAVPDGEVWAIDKNMKIVGKIVEANLHGQGGTEE